MSSQNNPTDQPEAQKLENQIREYARQHSASDTRKEIGRVFRIGKSARNRRFSKMFGRIDWEAGHGVNLFGYNIIQTAEVPKNGDPIVVGDKIYKLEGKPVSGGLPKGSAAPKVDIKGDKATVEAKGVEDIKTLEDLIKYCQIDLNVWEPKSFVSNIWDNKLQVKAEFRRKIEENRLEKLLEKFVEEADNFAPSNFTYQTPSSDRDCLYVLNIQDLHLSKLAWKKETGNSYDIEIAKEVFTNAVNDLMKKAPKDRIEEVVVICGSDFFQCDQEGMTTAGTYVDTDSRLSKSFEEGVNLLTSTIEKLSQNHKVRVMCYAGNHDASISLYAGYYISAWFKNHANVIVDNSPKTRKYYGYGKNLLAFYHGNEEKAADIPLIVLRENMETVSQYKYIECLSGHLHTEGTTEKNGVKLRVSSSLSGEDGWHTKKGFVGNIRTSQGLLYNKEEGIEAIYYSKPVSSN